MKKKNLYLIAAIISAAAAALGVFSLIGEARLVEVIAIFAGGFGAGASITSAIRAYKNKD
ncbi:MAG TPA: hypothetical protein VHP30_02655 [Ignavibacteriales bacterium]|nr:hypothetical protein [Ignavibacteriales bacterium]